MIVPFRGVRLVALELKLKPADPAPSPEEGGFTVIQALLENASQKHPAGAETETLLGPPEFAIDRLVGESAIVHVVVDPRSIFDINPVPLKGEMLPLTDCNAPCVTGNVCDDV